MAKCARRPVHISGKCTGPQVASASMATTIFFTLAHMLCSQRGCTSAVLQLAVLRAHSESSMRDTVLAMHETTRHGVVSGAHPFCQSSGSTWRPPCRTRQPHACCPVSGALPQASRMWLQRPPLVPRKYASLSSRAWFTGGCSRVASVRSSVNTGMRQLATADQPGCVNRALLEQPGTAFRQHVSHTGIS